MAPLPYLLSNDMHVALLMLACTFIASYLFLYYRATISEELRNLQKAYVHDREARFSLHDLWHFIFVDVLLAVLVAMIFMVYYTADKPVYLSSNDSILLSVRLAAYSCIALTVRNLLYVVVGYMFYNRYMISLWFRTVLLIDLLQMLVLLATVWLMIYSDVNIHLVIPIAVILYIALWILQCIMGLRMLSARRSGAPSWGIVSSL